jgi:hypothetical protein
MSRARKMRRGNFMGLLRSAKLGLEPHVPRGGASQGRSSSVGRSHLSGVMEQITVRLRDPGRSRLRYVFALFATSSHTVIVRGALWSASGSLISLPRLSLRLSLFCPSLVCCSGLLVMFRRDEV